MNEPTRCPTCHTELPPDAPAGVCPKCLVQAGFQSEPAATSASPAGTSFVPPSPAELARFFPQLEILELLGRGGMGAVYKARQPSLDRVVALKILPPEAGRDPAFAERFSREARALARLNHPHIVAIYESGEAQGLYYFVMEYVDGVNLRQTMLDGGVTTAQALAIIPQVCEALQYAHDEGVVHRDVKPENILLDKKGRVKIADFGLSKLLGHDAPEPILTATHQVMGTLRYMAPEQMEGTRAVDHRADIYSLGVVFYELLTGEVPMGRFEPPSHMVQIDVRLDEVVLRSLAREPTQRYQHASEVKTDVEIISRSPSAETLGSKGSASGIDPTARQVKGPAIGLLVAGWLYWLSIPFGVVALSQPSVYSRPTIQMNILFSLGLVPLVAGTVLVLAGDRMKRLEGRSFAIAACLLAIVLPGIKLVEFVMTRSIGMALGDFVAAPLGLWALVILSRRDVKAAFQAQAESYFLLQPEIKAAFQARQQPPAGGSPTRPQPPIAVSITWPRLPAWYGWVFGAGFVVAFVVAVALFVRIRMNSPSQPGAGSAPPPPSAPVEAPQPPVVGDGWSMGPKGPALTDGFALWVLKLRPDQVEVVNAALQDTQREYLALEEQNTARHTDEAGHVVTTIKPFPGPIAKLEDRLWSQLDAILDPQQQSVARLNLKLDPPEFQPIALSELVRPGFFGWGKQGASIEIWRVGAWHHWKVQSRGFEDSSRAAQLPAGYRRFWKEPETDVKKPTVSPR